MNKYKYFVMCNDVMMYIRRAVPWFTGIENVLVPYWYDVFSAPQQQ